MKILIPIDGSKHSQEGLKIAAFFAKAKGGEATVMNVVPEISDIDLEISAADRDRLLQSMKRRSEEMLVKAAETLKTLGVAKVSTMAESAASPAAEIIAYAEKGKFDLVVIGSKGKSATAKFVLGSTASKVVRYSPCCVYVVKEPCWT